MLQIHTLHGEKNAHNKIKPPQKKDYQLYICILQKQLKIFSIRHTF